MKRLRKDTRLAGLEAAQRMLKLRLGPHKTVDYFMDELIRAERRRQKSILTPVSTSANCAERRRKGGR